MPKEKTPLEIAEERIAKAKREGSNQLDLSGLQLSTLPESLRQLTKLVALELNNNQLSTLPEWLGLLTKIEWLHVNNNQLRTLPESLGKLTNLWLLYASDNQLRTLPESLRRLKKLKDLYRRHGLAQGWGRRGRHPRLLLSRACAAATADGGEAHPGRARRGRQDFDR